jgi:glyceraldehyde 3-phosphate dehydrogenase
VVKVIHESFGIRHGSITTIHDMTNTQVILDQPHKDLRRARACGMSLIPTTTGSATAIAEIFPELEGKLNGHAVRVPWPMPRSPTACSRWSAPPRRRRSTPCCGSRRRPAAGILGYEERPLVSIDYRTDPRSAIVDALSTMVVNRHPGEDLRLVRQRVGLRLPHRRAGPAGGPGRRTARSPPCVLATP